MAGRSVFGCFPAELTSFVGRGRELREVRRLVGDARLVTLAGVGGTGKTRLAVRVAAHVRRAFPDGAWFVDLTELRDPALLTQEVEDPDALAFLVAATLGLHDQAGVRPTRRLTDHLADRQAMLVLDNCEHLLPGCAVLIDRLLRSCPGLRILATSREPLATVGEVIFSVPPLPTPRPEDQPAATDLERYESVALFAARARAAEPGFELTVDNRAAVAELCHRLDGLPLAIELAAARVRALAPQQILDRLADRFALLSRGGRAVPARQQTLRACVDWSFDLCGEPERLLWARLAVFVGGFELDAVEGVCADEKLPVEELLDVVAGLVDKSILARDAVRDGRGERVRYRMLECVRDYGQDKLVEFGEQTQLRDRHADWYQQFLAQAAAEWISHQQEYWMARLTREDPNLRAAIEYCLTEPGHADAALYLAATLPRSYWFSRGLLSEARRLLDRALARTSTASALRAQALLFGSLYAITQGDGKVATQLLDRAEDLARQLNATVELAYAVFLRGLALFYRGDLPAAIDAFERVRATLSAVPHPESALVLELKLAQLNALAMASGLAGDHDRADVCLRESLAITELRGEHHWRSAALWTRAWSAWQQGNTDEASTSLVTTLRLKQVGGSTDPYGIARCIEAMAWVSAGKRQHRRAATLLGAADALWTQIGTPLTTFAYMTGDHEACERQVRAGLGDQAFTAAFAQGRALSYDDAISYALNEQRQPAPATAHTSTPLTRREQQVARLIAEGLSNKDIAGRLVISHRTAESHVQHILTKLGVTSRAQVAVWITAWSGDQAI